MFPDFIGSIIRHSLTSAGGALVAKGLIGAATVEPLVGAVMVIGGVLLSIINKVRNK